MRAPTVPTVGSERTPQRRFRRVSSASVLAVLAGVTAFALPAGAQTHNPPLAVNVVSVSPGVTATYQFTTLDNHADPTFNQLLGINDLGTIAGYFGSGTSASQPNKGYTLSAYSAMSYTNENYPGSAQTQVTGLNDMGKTVGFYADAAGDNFGFWLKNGRFSSFSAPGAAGKTKTTQLLGVNNEGMAVGFYNDANGNAHAFELDTKTGAYRPLTIPGAVQTTASAINDLGDIAGFYVDAKMVTKSFLLRGSTLEILAVPGASATEAFGVNDSDQVVGQYTVGKSTYGFIEQNDHFTTISDPFGPGTTTVNGINNLGDIVGFYGDSAGNTDGFVAQPQYLGTGA
jgi:hypothetical protein